VLQHIVSGRLKALAVTSPARIPALPEVPTLKESGVDAQIGGWYGFVAPTATPSERQAWLVEHMGRALAQKNTRDKLAELGSIAVDSSPQSFARMMAGERIRWQQLIREAGIKLD
jgi:tripartite-type tricarboxylate transporter receptor subunit TctC